MILGITLSAILIITHLISVLIFYDKVRRRKIEIEHEPTHLTFWFEAFADMPPTPIGTPSSTLKGYQRYRWWYYCWKTAFWDVLLKRKDIECVDY